VNAGGRRRWAKEEVEAPKDLNWRTSNHRPAHRYQLRMRMRTEGQREGEGEGGNIIPSKEEKEENSRLT
jgi:hypothetical protein